MEERALLASMAVLLALIGAAGAELGYNRMFEDVLDEFDDPNHRLHFLGRPVPEYVRGRFIQVGPAQWCWKQKRCVTHVLDGFSKLHQWSFGPDGVRFQTKFLQSGFRAACERKDDIAFNVMAQRCEPALSPLGFLNASNDNNNVNIFPGRLDGSFQVMSDTPTFVEVDRATLESKAEFASLTCKTDFPCQKLTGAVSPLMQQMVGGTAHPIQMRNGDLVTLVETGKVMEAMPGDESFGLYRMRAESVGTLEPIYSIPTSKASYAHSFGYVDSDDEGEFAIVIQQPIHYDLMGLFATGTLKQGFVDAVREKTNVLYLVPLGDGLKQRAVVRFEVPKFYYGHTVNAFSLGNGSFVVDINIQDGLFFDRYSMDVQISKTKRDAWPRTATGKENRPPGYATVTRYHLDANRGLVSEQPLFGRPAVNNSVNEHDLFKLHPADIGKPYCGYWAQHVFYKSTAFASWAVVRTELCGPEPVVAAAWHRPNWYPGEASFVPKPGSKDKTEGVVIFKAFDGLMDKSWLVVADASSLETIAEAPLPVKVGFTVHGEWFPSESIDQYVNAFQDAKS